MYNPWAVGLIILFSMLFLIGVNIGELDFLWEVGKTICLACIGVG
ncbi:MAG: CD1871A family CXXC motif-containing protein [Desulfobaccales bacterium]